MRLISLLIGLFGLIHLQGQSIELMPGTERFFGDVQWLKPLDEAYRWTLFSRTRATVDYDNNTDVFSGAYLNYTTRLGLGGTIVGRISSSTSGSDVGIHYFKQSRDITLYALPFISLRDELNYGWFSIFRYTPSMGETWKLYSSVELFSTFNRPGHAFSVQRLRLGLQRENYQFGLAINLSELGSDFETQTNPGVFVRREF